MKKFIAKVIINNCAQTRTIRAANLQNAKDILSKDGTIVAIKESAEFRLNLRFRQVDERILAIYIKELSTLLEAGVGVLDAFNSVAKGCDNARLRGIFNDICADLNAGMNLEQALKEHKSDLGLISLAMFSLGQNSGKLSNSLAILSSMLQEIAVNRAKFKKAIRYPAIALFSLIIAFNILIAMVIPSFQGVFDSLGGELPMATRAILWVEFVIKNYGFWLILGLIFSIFLWGYFYKFSHKFRVKFDTFILKIPLIKSVILHSSLAKFNLILSKLINAAMPVDSALEIANGVIENRYIKAKFSQAIKDICHGNPLSSSFKNTSLYENIAIEMIKAGEKSGAIDEMFGYISSYYKQKYDWLIDNLSAYLEPILLVVVSMAVLLLGLGIFMPLWELSNRALVY